MGRQAYPAPGHYQPRVGFPRAPARDPPAPPAPPRAHRGYAPVDPPLAVRGLAFEDPLPAPPEPEPRFERVDSPVEECLCAAFMETEVRPILATGHNKGYVRLWHAETGVELRPPLQAVRQVPSLVLYRAASDWDDPPAFRVAAVCANGSLILFAVRILEDGQLETGTYAGDRIPVSTPGRVRSALPFLAPDGKLVLACLQTTSQILFIDGRTGGEVQRLGPPGGFGPGVLCQYVFTSEYGITLATGYNCGHVRFSHLDQPTLSEADEALRPVRPQAEGGKGPIVALTGLRDPTRCNGVEAILSLDMDGYVKLWRWGGQPEGQSEVLHRFQTVCLEGQNFLEGVIVGTDENEDRNMYVLAGSSRRAVLLDVKGRRSYSIGGYTDRVALFVAYDSPDPQRRLVCASEDSVLLFDTRAGGDPVRTAELHKGGGYTPLCACTTQGAGGVWRS
jgi:hypothetical protein